LLNKVSFTQQLILTKVFPKSELLIFKLLKILNIFRLDGFNESVAFEIFSVEGQQILNVVGFHRGDDFRVVDFYAGNRMVDD
jgi:hypothetical protein